MHETQTVLESQLPSHYYSLQTHFATQIINTDLVIVGGGLSGISAAARAVELGKQPVVLEKQQFLGGAGSFPEGSLGFGTKISKRTWYYLGHPKEY